MTITEIIEKYGVGEEMDHRENESRSKVLKHWRHAGCECAMFRIRQSHYAGYVKIPGYDGDEESYPDVTVHGGITYTPDNDGWIGFDTAHYRDGNYDENMEELPNSIGSLDSTTQIWTPEKVKEETERLAQQVWKLSKN